MGPDRVATFPLFGHWPDKEYVYATCENTFTLGNSATWVKLIEHAFEQWQTATDLVDVTPGHLAAPSVSCEVDPNNPFSMILSTHNDVNEVFMVDTDDDDLAVAFGSHFKTNILFSCVYNAPACAISQAYLRGEEASRELTNDPVDILVNRNDAGVSARAVNTLHIPGSDQNYDVQDVKFNECKPSSTGGTDFYLYTTLLHEGGHALGLSGFSWPHLITERGNYVMSHPTIPESVMNYKKFTVEEPDCFPHPFDILAIYALYQTVR